MNSQQEEMVFVATVGPKVLTTALQVSTSLRQQGMMVEMNLLPERSLKAQLRQAGKMGCGWVVIVGEHELSTGKVIVRDMKIGIQQEMDLDLFLTALNLRDLWRNGAN